MIGPRIGLPGLLLLALASCASAPPRTGARIGAPYALTARANLPYGPLPAERGDLYSPNGVATPPGVLLIHGGGWVAGDRSVATGLARLIASRGVAVFNIDYRLANAASPDTRWPAQIVDAQLAVRWLRAHASALGIDANHMAAEGDSAGGQLALLLGVLPGIVPGDEAHLYPDQRPNVGAVADQFGPTDIATLPDWVHGIYPALFGTQTPAPDALAALSPLPHVTGRTGPVLIVQGDADVVVPPAQSQRLQAMLRSQGATVEYIRFPGGHGYQGLDGAAIYALQQRVAAWLAAQLLH